MQRKVENSVNNLNASKNMNPTLSASVCINRDAYNLPNFNKAFDMIEKQRSNVCESAAKLMKPSCRIDTWKRIINNVLPITFWLPNYKLKEDLFADIITGISVAIFQVPQSMGYCLIAHVPPVHGLYTAFFPALIFALFGTSRHTAIGCCAILSGVMTGNLVTEVMEENGVSLNEVEESMSIHRQLGSSLNTETSSSSPLSSNLETFEIANAASLCIGIYMFLFGILRLGFISIYLSQQLISGFATAASLYVFTSQLPYLFGISLPHTSGMFAIIKSYMNLFQNLHRINPITAIISVICCSILLFFKIYVNEKMAKRGHKIPIPIELLVVIGGTVVSHIFDLNNRFNIAIVGEIKRGLPMPQIPRFDIMKQTWLRCISLAAVGYTMTLTVGKLYGNKHGYEVRPNQELFALGTTNIFASFFRCMPSTASLPRSAVQEQSGGRTQVASFVNCAMMLVVLFYIGPLLHELPNCVLGSIVAVAVKSFLGQAKEFIHYWKVSKLDGIIWMVSFGAIVVLDIDFGLFFSIAFSLLVLIYKTSRPKSYVLGSANGSDVYVPVDKYNNVSEINCIKIYQFCGPLHFANVDYFKRNILKKTQFSKRNEAFERINTNSDTKIEAEKGYDNPVFSIEIGDSPSNNHSIYHNLIIDCSMISYCDTSGIRMLKKVIETYENSDVNVYLACISHIFTSLEKEAFFNEFSKERVYISIHDSVLNILNDQQKRRDTSPVIRGVNGMFMSKSNQ